MKNNSKLSTKELAQKETAELYRLVALRDDKELLEEFFQVGIRFVGLFPLAYCIADCESLPEPLNDWLEDGSLDSFLPQNLRDEDMMEEQARYLMQKGGILVVFNAQIWDYDDSVFDENGNCDGTMGNGWGYYNTAYVWVDSYQKVNKAVVDKYTELRESWIRRAEKKTVTK